MGITLVLEDFTTPVESAPPVKLTYEDGFATGLETGIARCEAEQSKLTSELTQTLADIGFEYAQARQEVLSSLRPLFEAIKDQLLPTVMDQTLGAHLVEFMMEKAVQSTATPITLTVSEGDEKLASDLILTQSGLPFTVQSDPKIKQGQIAVERNDSEAILDFSETIQKIQHALDALAPQISEVAGNG